MPSMRHTYQRSSVKVRAYLCVCTCVYVYMLVCAHVRACMLWSFIFPPDSVRKSEVRQEFIIEKYIAMKYTSVKEKERILEERE